MMKCVKIEERSRTKTKERMNTDDSLGIVDRCFSAEELKHVVVYHGCPTSDIEGLGVNRCCPLGRRM